MNKDNRAKLGAEILASLNEYADKPLTIKDVTEEYRHDDGYQGLEDSDVVFSIEGEMIADTGDLVHNFEAEMLSVMAVKDGFQLVVVIPTKDEEE